MLGLSIIYYIHISASSAQQEWESILYSEKGISAGGCSDLFCSLYSLSLTSVCANLQQSSFLFLFHSVSNFSSSDLHSLLLSGAGSIKRVTEF